MPRATRGCVGRASGAWPPRPPPPPVAPASRGEPVVTRGDWQSSGGHRPGWMASDHQRLRRRLLLRPPHPLHLLLHWAAVAAAVAAAWLPPQALHERPHLAPEM